MIRTLDQTRLPFERREIRLADAATCREAIVAMTVRGTPLIGAVAAFCLAFGLREDASDTALAKTRDWLASARPTAVNLAWALDRHQGEQRQAGVEAGPVESLDHAGIR